MVGLLQVGAHRDKQENMRKLESLLASVDLSRIDLLVVPEYLMADPTGMDREELYSVAEEIGGPWTDFFSKVASENGVFVVATMFERHPELRDGRVYNTALLIGDNGNVKAVYRKVHLFDAYGYRESSLMAPGSSPSPVVDVRGFKVAMAICFDLRFPELFRIYAIRGADLVAVPAGWYMGHLKEETLSVLARARSHENVFYTAVAVQYSSRFTGRSMLVDPLGVVTVDAGIGEKIVRGEVQRSILEEARKKLPLLGMRRPELYRELVER